MSDPVERAVERNFIFICGCPRSGTTVLTHLLNWNASVLLGIERFSVLFRRNREAFTPALFTSIRMPDIQPRDCGYRAFSEREYSAAWARPKDFGQADGFPLVGDKIPRLFTELVAFEGEAWRDRNVIVLQIVRNPFDVANSYERRKANQLDNWDLDYERAIADWTSALESAERALARSRPKLRFAVISYEKLFEQGFDALLDGARRIYEYLGAAPVGEEELRGLRTLHRNGIQRRGRRVEHPEVRERVIGKLPADALERFARLTDQALV